MACNFLDMPCAVKAGFSCKKCGTCGREVSLPAQLGEQYWGVVIANIERNCDRSGKKMPPPMPTPIAMQINAARAATPTPVSNEMPPIPPTYGAELVPTNGPGSFLKKYLSRIGITVTPNCACTARAQHMDKMGNDWCEANLDEIVGWLREEAEKRRLPFADWPARLIVKRAISASRKAQEAHLKTLTLSDNPVS